MSEASEAPTRVLFIGNSYTARNDMPHRFAQLAAAAGHPVPVVVQSIIAGGATLKRHWNAGVARQALAHGPWDFVVLQEMSTLPFKSPARYHENVRLFVPEIARSGARVALYLTWSRQPAPQAQEGLTRAVGDIAREIDARVVPVGPAWHAVLRADPALALYEDDGSHPTAAGSYLAACTFLGALLALPARGFGVADTLRIDRPAAATLHAAAAQATGLA